MEEGKDKSGSVIEIIFAASFGLIQHLKKKYLILI